MASKILIVDDDLYIRDLYTDILKDAAFEVEAAEDGVKGLEKIRKGGFDLILLDVMMPNLDGLGVLKELKDKPPGVKNGPLVLLTNLAHDPIIKEALNLGASGYLIKSDLNPEQLVVKVKEHLK